MPLTAVEKQKLQKEHALSPSQITFFELMIERFSPKVDQATLLGIYQSQKFSNELTEQFLVSNYKDILDVPKGSERVSYDLMPDGTV